MADYQSLLARAIANLPNSAGADARQAIYERARRALLTQLQTLRPPLPDSDIAKEAGALEKAIATVEAQYATSGWGVEADAPPAPPVETQVADAEAPQTARPPAPRPAAPPPSRQPPPPRPAAETSATQLEAPAANPVYAAPRSPHSVPASPPAATGRPPSPLPAAPRVATARDVARPLRSPQPPPVAASPSKPAGAGAAVAPPVVSAKVAGQAPPAANLANVVPSDASDTGAGGAAPQVVPDRASAFSDANASEPPVDIGRPSAIRIAFPTPPELKNMSSWPWLALAAFLGVVLSVAGAAIVMRQKPQDLAIAPPSEPAQEATHAPPKIAQRAQPAPEKPTGRPAPTEGQTSPPAPAASGPQTSPIAQAGSQPQASPQGAEGGTSAAPGATPQAPASQEAPAATALPEAARSAMLIASADNPQKPIVNLGSTVWSLIQAVQGQPATVGVKADADIPDLKMHATMTLRKNTDPTLQATHTIDLKFSFADGAPVTGFKDVGLPQMRKLDSTAAETLTSVKVKISDVYFLIALAKNDQDVTRNFDLMQTRAWFDFPLLLNDNRIAKLVFQKSEEGQAMLEKALEAWKQ